MEIKIEIGTRESFRKFKRSYQPEFLKKYGYHFYGYPAIITGNFRTLAESLDTKYGELIVHDDDIVTYVGNKKWSVSHEATVGKSSDNPEKSAVSKH